MNWSTGRIREFEAQGWPGTLARTYIQRLSQQLRQVAQTDSGREELLKKYRRKMMFASFWIAGGVIATAGSYLAAESTSSYGPGGGHYLLAWGPVLYGMSAFGYAFVRWFRYQRSGRGQSER